MSLGAAAGVLHNLPAPTTAFVGRERELAALADYLANPHVRLLTILGLGGIGKTRLALATAAAQLDGEAPPRLFPQGVIFVGLARLETPAQLVPAIAAALQLQFQPGREPQAQLLDYLRGDALLLVLDNFEHLRAAANLVDAILCDAAQVKVLVTSREKLNLQAEQLVPIGGMALPWVAEPDADRPLASYSAIQLFCERAQRVRPDFELNPANQQAVLEICRLVQGMPLGIVLAAAWLETHSPPDIAAEIHANLDFLASEMVDMPERQRSLRAAFNYAWRLLPEQERTVLQNLSTFRGGFTDQAAEAVAGAARRDLQGLVSKSLLELSAEGRYDVHELLRQFAAEKLAAAPEQEAAVRDQHSAYYCNFLSEHADSWHNAQQLETFNAVTLEADNVQRAWQWAVERADWLRLEPAMDSWAWYFEWRGRNAEAYAVFQTIVTSAANADAGGLVARPTLYLVWAKALTWQGNFAGSNHNLQQALQQSLNMLERPELAHVDVRRAKAFALNLYTYYSPDWVTARQFAEQSLALYRDYDDPWGIAIGLGNLAWLDWRTGHYAQAQAHAEAGLALHQSRGDVPEQLHTSTTLAWIYTHVGRLEEAVRLRREIIELCQWSGFHTHLINATISFAYTLLWQGSF
ncbi:MAG: AAA family ATPase, partial [Anaerolineales bacterium]